MGAQLHTAAETYVFPHLGRNHAARAALGIMCISALDSANEPLYYGGIQRLARALGIDTSNPKMAAKTVSKALQPLRDMGVIVPLERGKAENTKWLLNVRRPHPSPVDSPVNNVPQPAGVIPP